MNATKLALALAAATAVSLSAAELKVTVRADQPGAKINPAMWGIFFEDINFGADGGLYAELVKNRSFEFTESLMGWSKIQRAGAEGSLIVADAAPLNASNPRFLRAQVASAGEGFGLSNEGFRGIGVKQGEKYEFSVFARAGAGGPLKLNIELTSPDGKVLGRATVTAFKPAWQKHAATLTASAAEPKAKLNVLIEGAGAVDLDMISLFPQKTWRNRPGGLRADVAQLLADMKPGFMRFPGGCIVEGHVLKDRYQWKTTIGPVEARKLIINRWNDEFKHRPAPDYFQSFGLGFYEYFLLCDDIGAEPLPILNCGMACQFNSNELAPLDQLDPYIQDALDLIEFANGPATSEWGKKRAEMGHPEPFKMKLLGVGNEQWGPQYIERYARFAKVLKEKHPEIQLISSAGPDPDGEKFNFLWPKLRALNADLVDEHYYRPPAWFLDNPQRYDKYDRKGPKIFAGEYAAQSVRTVSPDNRNNWECALAEAAFLTGLERNADVVRMASYAPLSAHEEAWQWRPNLIWFDNLRAYGTPNYYVQRAFARNRGDVIVPVEIAGLPAAPAKPRCYASATRDDKAKEVILKLVNASAEAVPVTVQLKGARLALGTGTVMTLAGGLKDENSLTQPRKVAPANAALPGLKADFTHQLKPYSLTVFRVPVR